MGSIQREHFDKWPLWHYCWHMQLIAKALKPLALHPNKLLLADAEALYSALSALLRVYHFRDRDRICCHDISVTQCYALETLVQEGPMRSQTLAEHMLLDKSTTTRVVDALVRKGYVERSVAADDARALSLRVTRSGTALYKTINDTSVAEQVELLSAFQPSARVAAIKVLRRLAAASEERFVSGASSANSRSTTTADSCR
jgi:MarR family transcriptional regulator, 2-MHQ and catechol-resistance regulon repressor